MSFIPDPNAVFPNAYGTTCFIKNVVTAPNITIGAYTYYDDDTDPTGFERNNVLFNWPEFGDHLIIGKFCAIAQGTKFVMGPANHRMCSVTTYPFAVFGGRWAENIPSHLSQLPHKGDIVVGNDVWFGRECLILPGTTIGDGAIIAARPSWPGKCPPIPSCACGGGIFRRSSWRISCRYCAARIWRRSGCACGPWRRSKPPGNRHAEKLCGIGRKPHNLRVVRQPE